MRKNKSMKKVNESSLSLITGGYSSYRRVPTTALASVVQVSARPLDTAPNNDAYDETAPYCHQHIHHPFSPKNGDRNSLGQQYSWGTWWDDTH